MGGKYLIADAFREENWRFETVIYFGGRGRGRGASNRSALSLSLSRHENSSRRASGARARNFSRLEHLFAASVLLLYHFLPLSVLCRERGRGGHPAVVGRRCKTAESKQIRGPSFPTSNREPAKLDLHFPPSNSTSAISPSSK